MQKAKKILVVGATGGTGRAAIEELVGAGNVPFNNALAKVDADTVDAARAWDQFAIGWTRWNHVRTVASMAAAGAFVAYLVAA